jgi:hypothetical protein
MTSGWKRKMWRQNDDAAAAIGESGPESGHVTGNADLERLEVELAELERELRGHLASSGSRHGGAGDDPRFAAARERADDLATRRRDLRALIAEHRL